MRVGTSPYSNDLFSDSRRLDGSWARTSVTGSDSDHDTRVDGVIDSSDERVVSCRCSTEAQVQHVHSISDSRINSHRDVRRRCVSNIAWKDVVCPEECFGSNAAERAANEWSARVRDSRGNTRHMTSMILFRLGVKDSTDRLCAEHFRDNDLVAHVLARDVRLVDGAVQRVTLWKAGWNDKTIVGQKRVGEINAGVNDAYLDTRTSVRLSAISSPQGRRTDQCRRSVHVRVDTERVVCSNNAREMVQLFDVSTVEVDSKPVQYRGVLVGHGDFRRKLGKVHLGKVPL